MYIRTYQEHEWISLRRRSSFKGLAHTLPKSATLRDDNNHTGDNDERRALTPEDDGRSAEHGRRQRATRWTHRQGGDKSGEMTLAMRAVPNRRCRPKILQPRNASQNCRGITTPTARDDPPLPTAADFPSWAYAPKEYFRFEVLHQSRKSAARVGRITTPHGVVDTPGFVAVGTNAALKALDFPTADAAGQQLVFSNTYHLLLHPGPDVVRAAGGIHAFTGRRRPFITDSGGFQVFSLAHGGVRESLDAKGELKRTSAPNKKKPYWRPDVVGKSAVRVTDDGVAFKSYRDGSTVFLSPESSIQAQKDIGADVSRETASAM